MLTGMIAAVPRALRSVLLLSLLLPAGVRAQEEAPPPPDAVIAPQESPSAGPVPPPNTPLVPPGGVPPIGPVRRAQPPAWTPPPQAPPPPPIPAPHYSVELQLRLAFPAESSFDRALYSLRYDGFRVEPVGYVGVAVPVVEWFWIGGRYGMRGRQWTHTDQDAASVSAGDLLVTAQLRFSLGRTVELGVLVAGGAGFVNVQLNGVAAGQVVARFQAEATLAFKVGANFAIGPRVGWDYFQWDSMNRYDHGLDIGGPFIGIGLEGRE